MVWKLAKDRIIILVVVKSHFPTLFFAIPFTVILVLIVIIEVNRNMYLNSTGKYVLPEILFLATDLPGRIYI